MIPRFGERIDLGQRYRLRPGAYAILHRGKDILLTIQEGEEPDIQLPGGGIDPGESPLPALHREIFEETGWRVSYLRRLGAFRRFVYMPEYDIWAEKLCTIYFGRPTLQVSAPLEEDHKPLWLPLDRAGEVLGNAGDRAMLKRYAKSQSPV